jgi:beta-ureidopropionase
MERTIEKRNRLPREVWVAAMSLKGLWPVATVEQRMKDVLRRMESLYALEPDLICLPETINTSWVNESKTIQEMAEDEETPGPITSILAEVAKKQNCYITCPIITKKNGRFYDSSILLNRQGKVDGVYHKIHPTSYEITPDKYFRGGGITPGTLKPPVFKTDFGTVGMQICFDAEWADGWKALKDAGAEIVCFPSQGPYANTLSQRAWNNQFYVVGATGEDCQVIDMTGDIIASDGEFARWVCVPINLEKEFLHIWPHTLKFNDIRKKYGRKVRIKIYHTENWPPSKA